MSPTLTISAHEMSIHTQKIDVETAASPCGPMRVPTQNASTVAKSVMSSVDATAGSATAATVRVSEPLTSDVTDAILAGDRGREAIARVHRQRGRRVRIRRPRIESD